MFKIKLISMQLMVSKPMKWLFNSNSVHIQYNISVIDIWIAFRWKKRACIISYKTHCYLEMVKYLCFFLCSDSRLQECDYSGPQSKLSKASNLLRWETAIRDCRYSRRGKIWRWRQGGWWEKLATTVQSGVQKNWNSAR